MKVVAFSDPHGYLPKVKDFPECDVVCIAGDICPLDVQRDLVESVSWFLLTFKPWAESLPCKKVIFIGGNHDYYSPTTDRIDTLNLLLNNLDITLEKKICIVSQTTFNYNKFQDIVEIIAKKGYDITVLNTICNATEVRQTEARKVAQCSDVMIVIGDRHSSNTQKLFEICKNECKNTYYIQTSDEMDYTQIRSNNNVGITAGASTPNNIIEEVSKNVRNEL